jgi:hypothetical protein
MQNTRRAVYDCEICGHFHPWNWNGDCRDNENRFSDPGEYAARLGVPVKSIKVLTMNQRVDADRGGNKPTTEQIQALVAFARANGRTWKSKLNHAWMTGLYDDYPATDRCDLLQQVRNSFGPSWLVRFSLRKVDSCVTK